MEAGQSPQVTDAFLRFMFTVIYYYIAIPIGLAPDIQSLTFAVLANRHANVAKRKLLFRLSLFSCHQHRRLRAKSENLYLCPSV